MDDLALVQIVDCFKDLSDGLRRIFLGEFALVTNPIEEFSTSSQLSNNVILILQHVSKMNAKSGLLID